MFHKKKSWDFSRNCQTKPPEFVVRPHERTNLILGFFARYDNLNWWGKFQVLQGFLGKYENDQASRKISGGDFLPNLEFAREKTSADERISHRFL